MKFVSDIMFILSVFAYDQLLYPAPGVVKDIIKEIICGTKDSFRIRLVHVACITRHIDDRLAVRSISALYHAGLGTAWFAGSANANHSSRVLVAVFSLDSADQYWSRSCWWMLYNDFGTRLCHRNCANLCFGCCCRFPANTCGLVVLARVQRLRLEVVGYYCIPPSGKALTTAPKMAGTAIRTAVNFMLSDFRDFVLRIMIENLGWELLIYIA